MRSLVGGALSALALLALAPAPARAQWVTTFEQFYLQAPHNWVFRNNYQHADRLFNAFDYGHAILYEKLWTKPDAPASLLEQKEYDYLTKQVLVRPPRVPLEEAAIEIKYVQLAPEAKQMFEWAHILHRQIYDVLADERLDEAGKDREVQRLLDYYKSRRDIAFSSIPKSMKLMQEQPYSLAFRQQYPKFNGLIWAYHWLQVGLYEPLLVGTTQAERQAGVRSTVARFWQMLQDPPRTFPYQMPMTPAVAPRFAARYPEAAIIFDNLHSMHDVISDILANDSVPRNRKRAEIMLAARRFRDDTSYVMSRPAWLAMAQHMGIENMGGPSVGFLPALPTPTVTYGAVMSHDDRTGAMVGFKYGQATGGDHAAHGAGASSATPSTATDAAHAGHAMPGATTAVDTAADTGARQLRALQELHARMMTDSVVRRRVHADTALRRMMDALHADAPAEAHAEHGAHAAPAPVALPVTKDVPARASRPARASTRAPARPSARRPARPAARPAAPARDPHAGHGAPAPKGAPKPAAKPAAKPPADPHAGHRP